MGSCDTRSVQCWTNCIWEGVGGRQSITWWNSEASGKLQARPGRVQRGPGRGTRTDLCGCGWREPELWVPSTGVELLDGFSLLLPTLPAYPSLVFTTQATHTWLLTVFISWELGVRCPSSGHLPNDCPWKAGTVSLVSPPLNL